MSEERQSKYWICNECAKKKEWVTPDWPVTAITGLCGWCSRIDDEFLIPTCDYSGPNGKRAVWD